MQTSALTPATKATIPNRLASAARLIKNGPASMSREDKAAFGIDTWNTATDTPEALNALAAGFLEALAAEHLIEQRPDFLRLEEVSLNQGTGQQADELG